MKKRKNPGLPTWMLPVLGAGVVGGVVFWLYRRDKAARAAGVSSVQQPQQQVVGVVPPQVQQAAAAVVASMNTAPSSAPPLTPQQAAEMTANPETRHGSSHFNGMESYANSGAGHF